jgi:hypothetical protein
MYVNGSTAFASFLDIIGPIAWTQCYNLPYCQSIGCGPNAACALLVKGERTCTCNGGYTSLSNRSILGISYKLYSTDAATGCFTRMFRERVNK